MSWEEISGSAAEKDEPKHRNMTFFLRVCVFKLSQPVLSCTDLPDSVVHVKRQWEGGDKLDCLMGKCPHFLTATRQSRGTAPPALHAGTNKARWMSVSSH